MRSYPDSLLALLRCVRFRRAIAALVALAFLLAAAVPAMADADAAATRIIAAGQMLEQAPDPGDPGDGGAKPVAPHGLPCPCHTILGGDPAPYALAVPARPAGGRVFAPVDQRLASLTSAPPIRPPCA